MTVLGHTRWASVGIISEPNTHPLNSDELERSAPLENDPYVIAALNGDVDNHAELRVEHQLRIHEHITTDAKVIPALVSRYMAAGSGAVESFRRTVSAFEGSVAIGAISAGEPDTLLLAFRGSGQGLYVGLAEDCFIVASEPYGVVEETNRYLRLDGEQGGEIVALRAGSAGQLDGIQRLRYDGAELPRHGIGGGDGRSHRLGDIDRGESRTSCSKRSAKRRKASTRRCAPRSPSAMAACTPLSATGRSCPRSRRRDWRPERSRAHSSDRPGHRCCGWAQHGSAARRTL